jgi:hypothetical protein
MKKSVTLALALVTLALIGTGVMAQTRTIVLNTGYDQANSTRIAVGQQDNEWRVISDTINGAPQPPPATGRPADVVLGNSWAASNPSLAVNFPNSRWISINPNQGQPLSAPPNKFQYAFYFTLPQGFSSPQLTMKLSSDDRITKITLNSATLFQGSGGIFNSPPLPISVLTASEFNSGATVNVITVEVEDTAAVITGLIVDGTVTYEDCDRSPIRDIPGLTSITFWESTSTAPTQHTFAKSGPELATRLNALNSSNKDFEGVSGAEFYDVFYSDWNGTPNPNGQFVTIEADWNVGAPSGGGLNIAKVDFNGTGQIANSVSSFVALGDNAMPNDVGKAVDGLTSTDTTMGNTIGQTQRLRVTVGFPCPRVLPPRVFGTITGRVIDPQNRPVRGTLVQVPGRMPIRTTANGTFTFDNLALTDRLAISFSASGFVDTTRVFPVWPGVLNATDIVLLRRAPAVVINATNGGRVTFAQGGGLTIPPRSLVDPGGKLLTGDVRVSLTYLDFSDPKQIRSAPGDFTATMRDNSVRTLESFGIFEAYLEDLGGRRADLASGKTAIINLPIPRSNLGNVPRTIGLFSFGTTSGRWMEAGTLIRSDDGLTYNGTISTLDVNWNGDDPVDTTCIRVQVFEPHFPNPPHGPPAVNSHVTATGVSYNGSSDGYTDSNGFVCLLVKRNSQVSLQAFSTQVSSYVSVPIVITTPNIASGAADCGNLAKCPLAQEIDLDIIVGRPSLTGGMNEFCVWSGGGGSYNSQTRIDNPFFGVPVRNNRGVRFGAFGLCYGRILSVNDRFAFKYTFNAIPVAVLSYPDINRDLGIPVPGSEIRPNVFGAGLSPIGFQLYFRPQSRIKPFVNTSGGFLFFNDPVPQLNGARFNFTYDFGGGVQVFRDSQRAFNFGYKYQHLSSGGRALNNPGFNAHIFYFGYSIFSAPKIAQSSDLK